MVRRALVALQFAIMIGLGITAATIWRQTLFSLHNQLRVDGSSVLLVDDACAPSNRAFRERLANLPGIARAACANEAALFDGGMIVSAQVQGGAATPMLSGVVDYGALEFYGLRPLAGRFFDRDHGDDGRLVAGDTEGNPSIVVNETAMRKLGFSTPDQAIGKVVTWNRRRWSANPTPGTTGPSEIIGVSADFALDTRREVYPQILYIDPVSFSVLSVRLIGSQIPEALAGIDAAWSHTMHTSIHRRFLSQRLQGNLCRRHTARDGHNSRRGSRRCNRCVGIVRTVSSFGRTAHQRDWHQKGLGRQFDRHSDLDAWRIQPAGSVGKLDRLALRVLHFAALARGVCSPC